MHHKIKRIIDILINIFRKSIDIKIIFLITVFFVLFCSCSKKPDPIPNWNYQSGGIKIQYSADSQLNSFNGNSHTVVVGIYQLDSIDKFQDLAKNEKGIKELLLAERFDQSVISVKKVIIQPSEKNKIIIDRNENSRWIGIVAGYYSLNPENVIEIIKIPVKTEEKGRFIKHKTVKIENMDIVLILGSNRIFLMGKI
jgi:type VI secretion system VasD/TssJ family lipoprotein